MKALVGTFNQEKALVRGLLRDCKTSRNLQESSFKALVTMYHCSLLSDLFGWGCGVEGAQAYSRVQSRASYPGLGSWPPSPGHIGNRAGNEVSRIVHNIQRRPLPSDCLE